MKIKVPKITFWRAVLIAIWTCGLYAAFIRYTRGLGAATNLSDQFPWGIWIGFDILVGVGLAAGGFVITATVYVFNLKEFKPIARPTVITAFLGYLLVICALLFDLGKPYNVWHPIIMWNPHSVMFEVGWCVMCYTTVLFLEFLPMLFERFRLEKPLRIIRSITIPIVILGFLLSTLHQSSLGTLYVIVPNKLHPLWYSGYLPLFFFVSAVGAGLAMVIFESYLSARAFHKQLEFPILVKLSRVMALILALWVLFRFEDLAARNALHYVFDGSLESLFFLAEILIGAIIPIILIFIPSVRNNIAGLFVTAVFVIIGFITNRLNVSITGMQWSAGVQYFPSWMELAITASIVAAGFVFFRMAAKYLPVFEPVKSQPESITKVKLHRAPLMIAGEAGKRAITVLGALLVISVVGLGIGFTEQQNRHTQYVNPTTDQTMSTTIMPEIVNLPQPIKFKMSEDSPGQVIFSHETHVDPDEPNCKTCHMQMFKIRPQEPGAVGSVNMEKLYEGKQCGSCHNGDDSFSIDDGCDICHQNN